MFVANNSSFIMQWVPEITYHSPKTPFLLVGTQIDFRDDPVTIARLAKNKQKPIKPETAEKLARDLKAVKYVECSALTQVGMLVTVFGLQSQVLNVFLYLYNKANFPLCYRKDSRTYLMRRY